MSKILEKLLNNVCLDERITDGTFDVANNDHIDVMREYLINKGIEETAAIDFSNRVVEGGKHPDRQAYNKNGILVTFPTPQHKQNAIRRRTHFEKDPTKGKPNLFGPDPETGKPRKGPGRPPKDDAEKDDGEYTPPSQGGGQSISADGGSSSLPVSGDATDQTPGAEDSATTTSVPEPDGESSASEPAETGPPDVFPPKAPEEKEQDKKAIFQMMNNKNVALGSHAEKDPDPLTPANQKDKNAINVAKLYMNEAMKAIDRLSNIK